MLDPKLLQDDLERVRKGLQAKNVKINLDAGAASAQKRKDLLLQVEALKAERNQANDVIGQKKAKGENAQEAIDAMKEVSAQIKKLDAQIAEIEQALQPLYLSLPNLPDPDVPLGKSAEDNKVIKEWGAKRKMTFRAKDHVELGEKNQWLWGARAAKMTSSGFALYHQMGARVERALINFMLDLHTTKHGYTEISPPFLVNRASMTHTGQLPKMEEDMYALKDEELYLIPTAEVPVTNIHTDEILNEEDLPLSYVAYTPCFRREAGSYGKDTKGLTRLHQFDKVELVKFTTPEKSEAEHETLLSHAEAVLQALELPYRVVLLCSGDMSFAAAKCYDIEVWAPGADRWLEVSSCSNFRDFQARRANIRYRKKADKKTTLVHTLNGSGVALARTMIAVLENGQNQDGSISLPSAIQPYVKSAK